MEGNLAGRGPSFILKGEGFLLQGNSLQERCGGLIRFQVSNVIKDQFSTPYPIVLEIFYHIFFPINSLSPSFYSVEPLLTSISHWILFRIEL